MLLALGCMHSISASGLARQAITNSESKPSFSKKKKLKKIPTPAQAQLEEARTIKNTLKTSKREKAPLPFHKKTKNWIVAHKKLVSAFFGLLAIILILRFSALQEIAIFPGAFNGSGGWIDDITNFKAKDGTDLFYKEYKTDTNKKAVLFFLGNAGSITQYPLVYLEKISKNIKSNIYMFDYRGYGLSRSTIKNEQQLYEDANEFFDHVKKQGTYKEENMFVLGESLGGAFAIDIASKHLNIGGLIIRSTFTSLYQVVCEIITRPLACLLIRYELNSLKKMDNVICPVLAFHGKQDTLIRSEHAEKLRDAYSDRAKYSFNPYEGEHDKIPDNFYIEIGDFIANRHN